MSYTHHHNHDRATGVHSGGAHNHHHQGPRVITQPYTPVVTTSYNPRVHVHTTRSPQLAVVSTPGYRSNYYYSGGTGVLVGSLIILPIIVLALIFKLTMGFTAASLTTAGVAGAGVAGAIGLNVATFGIGALVLYGALGLVSLYSSAKECYKSDKNVFDMIKSRVINEDGLSFKGVMKSIGAVLWSPFLLLGGLAGMGVKLAVNARTSKSSSTEQDEVDLDIRGSYTEMSSDFPPQNSKTPRKDVEPIYSELYTKASSDVSGSYLLDSQTSFDTLSIKK
ncbi:hypothetical protein [Legionella sp. WA2022007384]